MSTPSTLQSAESAGRIIRWHDPAGASGYVRRVYVTQTMASKLLKENFGEPHESPALAEQRRRDVVTMIRAFTLGDEFSVGIGASSPDLKCLTANNGVWDVWAWRMPEDGRTTRLLGAFVSGGSDFLATGCVPKSKIKAQSKYNWNAQIQVTRNELKKADVGLHLQWAMPPKAADLGVGYYDWPK